MASKDYQKEFKGKCLTCSYYDLKDPANGGKFRCKEFHNYFVPSDKCSRYSNAAFRTDSMIDEAFKEPCYITTVVCNILGYDDNCEVLVSFRKIREAMKKSQKGLNALKEYDYYGPMIAKNLQDFYNDPEMKPTAVMIASALYTRYFNNILDYALKGEYNEAIQLYTKMTKILLNEFNITYEHLTFNNNDDIESLGHARKRQK